MAICQDCNQEMRTADSCTVSELHLQGVAFSLLEYGRDGRAASRDGRCGDCGVLPGGFHHLGCDLQPCPRCHRQLLSCDCRFDELGGEEDDDLDDDDLASLDEDFGTHINRYGLPACARCGSEAVIPIFYGRATPVMKRLESDGVLELAGQPFGADQSRSRCRNCEYGWPSGTSVRR